MEQEKESSIIFAVDNDTKEIIKLCDNGDIYVKGKLVENDKEVTNALREFIKESGYLK